MSGAITAVATAVSAAAANTAAVLGASSAVIEGVSTFAYTAATIGITTGVSAGIGAAFAPKIPDPTALQTPLKQPMPVRPSAFGRVRQGGAYAYFGVGTVGSTTNLSIDILALLDGRSQAIVSYYLNDDLMADAGNGYWYAPGAPGKYGGGGSNLPNLVSIDGRLGAATETSFSDIAPALPLWDSSHRGDGVTSMAVLCKPARREDQSGDYPNGLPIPSAVIDAQLIFDPRDESQTQGDNSTYVFSDNPVLCLLAYLTDASGGMGLDYARFIEPAIDSWIAAADECDGLVSTSGMHATLLDAADVGDNKIFLADTTGLEAGTVISLPTEDVTVDSLGLAGEVDLTSDLLYAHSAGELAYWDASGQSARYRCAGTYGHDTPPGDVVKSIQQTFDGWLGQRGDGALVVRTNTVYAPTVILGDRHIVGYQIQHFLPDEQATNQYIVSYTDPASAFNKAEAGYVQDDGDIAARGQVRSQELYLQWVPSGPQATAVARAQLDREVQPLRGTVTCNLSGLAVMGERYVRLQISELPALNNIVVEVTGKVSIDLQSMTVSFPWVAVSTQRFASNQALCFVVDTSGTLGDPLPFIKAGIVNALTLIGATFGGGLDIAVFAGGNSGTFTSIVKRGASTADLADVATWVDAIAYQTGPSPTVNGFDAEAAFNEAKSVFFDDTDAGITARRIVLLWDGVSDPGGIDSDPTALMASAQAAAAVLASMPGTLCNVINNFANSLPYSAVIDNTPDDGIPTVTTAGETEAAIESAVFGSSSTPGSGYTLPPLAPPSGSPLQPLTAPTIISVTPDYPDSGGGVQGARLLIEVDDPGPDGMTWKAQWKLSADSLWTQIPGPLDAAGSPLTIVTGLIAASGSIDVQIAYSTASQVSPWSATTTATVAASDHTKTDITAGAALTAGQIVNIYTNSGAANIRAADVTDDSKPADGFVLSSVSSAAAGSVYGRGQTITGLTGLTPGAVYYLAASGGVTATQPTSGWLQIVGKALSATTLRFDPDEGKLL